MIRIGIIRLLCTLYLEPLLLYMISPAPRAGAVQNFREELRYGEVRILGILGSCT